MATSITLSVPDSDIQSVEDFCLQEGAPNYASMTAADKKAFIKSKLIEHYKSVVKQWRTQAAMATAAQTASTGVDNIVIS